jgi:hypothetical protein
MSLLNELVQKYAAADLEIIFDKVGIDVGKISPINRQILKEVTLAQWLLASDKATHELAVKANNFARLQWRDEMNGLAEIIEIKVASEPALKFCKFKDVDAFIVGYWKFLTRTPYIGLEENTNTPENFLGFLQARGYTTEPNYVKNVVNFLPEAQNLLTSIGTGGVVIPLPVEQLQLLRAPTEVAVGQIFRIEGVARQADIGKVLSVTIDDKFPAEGVPVDQDGKWQFDFVFNAAGERTMSVATGTQTVELVFKVKEKDTQPSSGGGTQKHPGAKTISLSSSVGVSGLNKSNDIKAVKQRLHELGYTWVDPNNPRKDRGLDGAIRLFQSIIAGSSTLTGDGRVDVGWMTHQWLQAANAPMWTLMPKSDPDNGFVNGELVQTQDQHDFGTHWLADVIIAIAKDYQNTHRNTHPKAAPFAINDISLPHGGNTPHHHGHETGLMCDVFLPRKDGKFGGIDFNSPEYDQKAARAILKSIRKQKLVRAVFFNDPQMIREKLCTFVHGHHHHFHFEISPPVRK